MKQALIITRPRFQHQRSWADAFRSGLQRHGWNARITYEYSPADLVVMWSTRRRDTIARAKADGAEVCILERGYVGDRKQYSSVSFGGGLNGRAEFRGPFGDPSRWRRLFAHHMREYDVPTGGYALIMGQVPGDMSIFGADIDRWYQIAFKGLQNVGWSDIRFRAHPQADKRGGHRGAIGMKQIGGSLSKALAGASIVITFNSNSGVDAALYGRPVVAMDEGSMAWPVAGHQVDEVVICDRSVWAHAIAWKQWTKDEMSSGECWAAVGN